VRNGKISNATGKKLQKAIKAFKKQFLVDHPNREEKIDLEATAEIAG
jgi:hypothetical protein